MITVPDHKTLKIGTLSAILAEVSQMRSLSIEALIKML
jgi:hypothetical protein